MLPVKLFAQIKSLMSYFYWNEHPIAIFRIFYLTGHFIKLGFCAFGKLDVVFLIFYLAVCVFAVVVAV